MRKQKSLYIIIFFLIIVLFFVWYNGYHKHLSLTFFQENRDYLENAVAAHYGKSVLMYICVYAGIISLAIPGAPLLTMLGGFLFGFIPGGLYALCGAIIGTSISFLIIRHILVNIIRGKYAQKLEQFNEKLKSQGVASYLLTMHLVGLVPYFVINSLAALANVPFFTFFWTTCVGSIPILFIYAFAGRQLYLVESIYDIFSSTIIGLLLVLIIMSMLPLFFRKTSSDVQAP